MGTASKIGSVRHGTVQAMLIAGGAMLLFESAKELARFAARWSMTPWESHWLTIAFSSLVAGIVARHALRVQARTLEALNHESATRQVLEARQAAQAEVEAQLRHQAFHDPLTGLPNRALFRDQLARALARAERDGWHSRSAVLLVDLDDFKAVNDTLGHATGDSLLQLVAERLRSAVRSGDTVARLSGDEFAVLIEELDSMDELEALIERLRAHTMTPCTLQRRTLRPSFSSGGALVERGTSVDEVLRLADVALYEAKGAGKACHRTFAPSMHAAILRRLEIEADLTHAIEDPVAAGFSLAYQPIVGLTTGELVGVETLVRWQHPVRGPLPPSVFIPLAEASQTILPLGAWIMAEACRQLAEWQHSWRVNGIPHARWPSMTLNVSGRQLMDPGFPDLLERTLAASGAAPRGLVLELTETVLLEHSDAVADALGKLKALGVRFAVDDFGTGYSSLSYLRRFPVDILKIDRSFVEALSEDTNDALVRAIVALGESMRLSTIAEGIETPTQRDALAAMGCHAGQGFLFAAPLSGDALRPWIALRSGDALPLARYETAHRAA